MTTPAPLSIVTEVKKADLCRLLGLSDQSISNYVKLGLPASNGGKGQGARYNLSDCITWVREYEIKKAVNANKTTDDDIDAIKHRQEVAKMVKLEYEAALLMESMILVADAEREISIQLEAIRQQINSVPGLWAPRVLGLKSIPDAMDRLSGLLDVLLNNLSNPSEDTDDDSNTESDDVTAANAIEDDT